MFQLWRCIKLFQGFLQLHSFMILNFLFWKLNICLGYILHKISLILWISPVLTNLFCLIEYVLLINQCLLIILVSTNSNDKCMPASFSEWWGWSVLKEQSWTSPIFTVRNLNKKSLLQNINFSDNRRDFKTKIKNTQTNNYSKLLFYMQCDSYPGIIVFSISIQSYLTVW